MIPACLLLQPLSARIVTRNTNPTSPILQRSSSTTTIHSALRLCRMPIGLRLCRPVGQVSQHVVNSSRARSSASQTTRRYLQTSSQHPPRIPKFAFAFDIDGVLVRSADPLPRAHQALSYLQRSHIPFILLTNGGGKHETERVADLSAKLAVPLDTRLFIQSHTPFAGFEQYKDKTVLVVGGDGDKCRDVATRYGFKSVLMPCDIYAADPTVWPFSSAQLGIHTADARPLPRPLPPVAAILVFNDPRDWGLDLTVIVDLLLSKGGQFGTLSEKNNNDKLPNRGYQQDGQPEIWFSNPDLWWAASHPLPRFGQGGFREALEGMWAAVTGGPKMGVELKKHVIGKPYQKTYEFAEKRLIAHRSALFKESGLDIDASSNSGALERVYMVGDNPESDIRGGNTYKSPLGVEWNTALVKTGVYVDGTEPTWKPTAIVGDVWDAVEWAVEEERRRGW